MGQNRCYVTARRLTHLILLAIPERKKIAKYLWETRILGLVNLEIQKEIFYFGQLGSDRMVLWMECELLDSTCLMSVYWIKTTP